MSTEACILAVGPFSPDIAYCLEYPADHYKNVPEGTMVASELPLVHIVNRGASEDLAQMLGCELSEPATWAFDAKNLEVPFDGHDLTFKETERLNAALKAFSARGFQLFFRPDF